MSSTVTSSTIATVLKMASSHPDAGVALVVTLVATLTFLVVAVQKEIFGGVTSSSRWAMASRGLNISLIPLGLTFLVIFIQRLLELNSH